MKNEDEKMDGRHIRQMYQRKGREREREREKEREGDKVCVNVGSSKSV